MGLTNGSASHAPFPGLPLPGAPTACTHRAWVKALSPSGTAVSPFPEQSTRRSPSQLQGTAHRGGAAPLGSAKLRSPRAKKQSSPSGPGIAAADSRAGLFRGAARSARLRCPPPPPGSRPAGWGRGSPLSAVARARPLQQSAAVAQGRGAPEFLPFHCSMEAQRQPQSSGGSGQPARPGAATETALCHRVRLPVPASRCSCSSRLRSAAFSHAGPSPQAPARLSHKHPGSFSLAPSLARRRGSISSRPFPSRVARSGSQAPSHWVMQIT